MSNINQETNDILFVDKYSHHWVIKLNRPEKMNALSAELVEMLISIIDAAESENIPLLVFQGEGKNFCAGFDFTDLNESSDGDLLLRFVRIEVLLQKIAYSNCLTLALVHGLNFGAGVDIIASCKLRVSEAGSKFRMPGLKFGLALGTRRLAQLLGTEIARDILQTCRTFDIDEAISIGFINQQVRRDDWQHVISKQIEIAESLTNESRKTLYKLTTLNPQGDGDMAALVKSASAPGLKDRIISFRKS